MDVLADPEIALDAGVTAAVIALAVGVFVVGSRIAGRPPDPRRPRLVPWRTVLMAAGVLALLAVAHLLGLAAAVAERGR